MRARHFRPAARRFIESAYLDRRSRDGSGRTKAKKKKKIARDLALYPDDDSNELFFFFRLPRQPSAVPDRHCQPLQGWPGPELKSAKQHVIIEIDFFRFTISSVTRQPFVRRRILTRTEHENEEEETCPLYSAIDFRERGV